MNKDEVIEGVECKKAVDSMEQLNMMEKNFSGSS
jgi:hypothetical protein